MSSSEAEISEHTARVERLIERVEGMLEMQEEMEEVIEEECEEEMKYLKSLDKKQQALNKEREAAQEAMRTKASAAYRDLAAIEGQLKQLEAELKAACHASPLEMLEEGYDQGTGRVRVRVSKGSSRIRYPDVEGLRKAVPDIETLALDGDGALRVTANEAVIERLVGLGYIDAEAIAHLREESLVRAPSVRIRKFAPEDC